MLGGLFLFVLGFCFPPSHSVVHIGLLVPYLDFKGRKAVESLHSAVPHHSLEFDASASILSEDEKPSLDGNLIIEGDSLEALKALLPTHAGKIKCIYIDLPYNTGNEGWVYHDNYSNHPILKEWWEKEVGNEEDDPCRHDKWCCMVYPRLQLMYQLLADDGVIFISIDDNEVHHARCLLDEIFGSSNFTSQITWKKRSGPPNDKVIGNVHEYILIYGRKFNETELSLLPRSETDDLRYTNPDGDLRGPWVAGDISANAKGGRFVSSLYYEIENPETKQCHLPPSGACWRFSQEKVKRFIKEKRIFFGSDGQGRPKLKRFLCEVRGGLTVPSLWTDVGTNTHARSEIVKLFNETNVFETPKPTSLIRRILQTGAQHEDTILDCTAGSGTTAHAVLQLNAEDGGNRRFILIQRAQDTKDDERRKVNICHDITRERVRRVIEGVNTEALGGSFTYARLSKDPMLGIHRELQPGVSFLRLAQYLFYTVTSRQLDESQMDAGTGYLGQWSGGSLYLRYNEKDGEEGTLDRQWLDAVAVNDPNSRLTVFCERFLVHREDLRDWQSEHRKSVQERQIPFNLP